MMLRLFCQVQPGAAGDGAYRWLMASYGTGMSTRAIPIGASSLTADRRWYEVASLFMTPIQTPFVNVVHAPCGLMMGGRMEMSSSLVDMPMALQKAIGDRPKRATPGKAVYEPQTALAGLYTVGCVNVAILASAAGIDDRETRALRRYDSVICEDESDAEMLRSRSIKVTQMVADSAKFLEHLRGLCGSDITATTLTSPDTAELPGTTCPPSGDSRESTSRSPTSETTAVLRRAATGTLTGSRCPPRASLALQIWRFITRPLRTSAK